MSTDPNAGQPNQSVQAPAGQAWAGESPRERAARESRRLAEIDKPIEYDPVGQALLGGAVGGALAGFAGAGEAGVEIVGTAAGEAVAGAGKWVQEKPFGGEHSESEPGEGGQGGQGGRVVKAGRAGRARCVPGIVWPGRLGTARLWARDLCP